MGNCTQPINHCVLGIIAAGIACLHEITHQVQNLLNTCWYRLALTTINRLGRWPNLTTGQLGPIPVGLYTNEEGRAEQHFRQVPRVEPIHQELRNQAEKSYFRETLV